ncbi:MAG: peroxiredoxin [Deltaproteobacteria bacterium]|nr:peroxiredoxin [Deltaproteobacteria bacterium]
MASQKGEEASSIQPEFLLGKRAPFFELEGDDGKRYALKDFEGSVLVLYFYPKDDTPGCTSEAKDFTALNEAFRAKGARVVGVSRDTVEKHKKFKEKHGIQVLLLSDPEGKVHREYGVLQEKTMYGKKSIGTVRTTFLIDAQGVVRRVFSKVKVAGHAQAVLQVIDEEGVACGKVL